MSKYLFLIFFAFFSICAKAEVGVYASKDGLPITSTKNITVVSKDGEKAVLTILTKYQTKSKNLLYIIPVSGKINENSIKTFDPRLVHNILSYNSPRIAEYYDFDPCDSSKLKKRMSPKTKSFQTIGDDYALGLNYSNGGKYNDYKFTIFKEDKNTKLKDYLSKRGYKLPKKSSTARNNPTVPRETFLILEIENNNSGWLKPLQFEVNTKDLVIDLYNEADSASSINFLIFITKNGEVKPQNIPVKHLPSDIIVGTSESGNINNFIDSLLIQNTPNNEFSMLYSWPFLACKPCINPIPSIDDMRELGVFWYNKPKRGRYGLIAPFSVIYTTTYFYKNLDKQIRFSTTPFQNNYQALYKIYEPIGKTNSSCIGNYSTLLEKSQKKFSANKERLEGSN